MHPPRTSPRLLAASLMMGTVTVFAHAASDAREPSSASRAREVDAGPVSSTATGKTSGNGIIKEINAQQFDAIDRDNDDHISLTEFTSSPILRGDAASAATGQSPTVAAPRSDGTVLVKPAPGRNTPELFRRLDRDRDGFLDSVEIAAYYLSELED